ncbi:hypothetical protein TGP89_249690 [Toxoplasma gondii p89]|uniref:Uncharacterized protein n=1 Tax=Toxoplasma gondii p89 TaxID=943119 RepID=A0A086KWW9_TOXGO|nr:hypothetical protein TGP89_249690 [Toxoplasma gondii p89]
MKFSSPASLRWTRSFSRAPRVSTARGLPGSSSSVFCSRGLASPVRSRLPPEPQASLPARATQPPAPSVVSRSLSRSLSLQHRRASPSSPSPRSSALVSCFFSSVSSVRVSSAAACGGSDVASSSPHGSSVTTSSAIEQAPLRDPLVNPSFTAQKIPKDYVKKTLIPHLENQIAVVAKALNELELANLAAAYSKLPPALRHPELCRELAEKVKFRMNGFGAQEIVLALHPLFSLVGDSDKELWRLFAERIEKEFILRELSVLNLVSVLRVFEKLEGAFGDEFAAFVATLQDLLKAGISQFDAIELHDTLVALSMNHRETKRDLQLVRFALAEMDKKVHALSLLNQLSLLQALVRLKIEHRELTDLVASQLQDGRKIRNMPPKFVAQTVWVFAKLGRLADVACTVGPLMEHHIKRFSVVDFARLAQALPAGSSVPLRVCRSLQERLASMSVKEFCFFLCACVRLNILPDQHGRIPYFSNAADEDAQDLLAGNSSALIATIDAAGLLESLVSFMNAKESEFRCEDIRRVVLVLQGYAADYGYLLQQLPEGWKDIEENLDTMAERQETSEKA